MRVLLLHIGLCLMMKPAFAQKAEARSWNDFMKSSSYAHDTLEVLRLQDQSRTYLLKPGEEKTDLDMAQALLNKSIQLGTQIGFKRGVNEGFSLQAKIYHEQHNTEALEAILPQLSVMDQLEMMKAQAVNYIMRPGPTAIDTSYLYAQRWQKLAQQHHLGDIANEAEYYQAVYAHRKGNVREEKRHFLNMIAFHTRQGKPWETLTTWLAFSAALSDKEKEYPTKIDCIDNAVQVARNSGRTDVLVFGLQDAGQYYFEMGETDKAESALLESEAAALKHDVRKRYRIYENLSRLYMVKANGSKAWHYARAALDNVAEVENTAYNIGFYQSLLAEVYYTFGQMDKYKTLISAMKGEGDPAQFDNYFYILSYSRLLAYDKGPQAALDYLAERKKKVLLATYSDRIRFELYRGLYFEQLKKNEEALHAYITAEEVMGLASYSLNYLGYDVYIRLANVYYQQKKYDNAQIYINKLAAIPNGMLPLYRQTEMHTLQYKIDSLRGDYVSALRHFNSYKSLNDSLFNIEKLGQLEELDLKYETAKKDHDLQQRARDIYWLKQEGTLQKELLEQSELNTRREAQLKSQAMEEARQRGEALKYRDENYKLLEKKWELQQTVISQALTTRRFIILGAVLLFLLLLVIYNRYRLKQRSNRQLQQQQEEITSKNESLQKLVSEKEWLLKEVHHRVKNNLQVVMSLLNTQSFYLQDETAIAAIRDSQRRVNAISLIHKKLYQSDNPATVNMQLYIKELLDYLQEYASTEQHIVFKTHIAALALDLSKAIPIGLILNEAITNAFKYAFRGRATGKITVGMQPMPDNKVLLTIADDGVGMAANVTPGTASLGMTLMQGLSRDIGGEFSIRQEQGTVIAILFSDEVYELQDEALL